MHAAGSVTEWQANRLCRKVQLSTDAQVGWLFTWRSFGGCSLGVASADEG